MIRVFLIGITTKENKLEEHELFKSRLFSNTELRKGAEKVLFRLHDRNLAISRFVKSVQSVFPDLRVMLIRSGMLLSYSGVPDDEIEAFYKKIFKDYEMRLSLFVKLRLSFSRRFEAFVTILYDSILKIRSFCEMLDRNYPRYDNRVGLSVLQKRRLKLNDICATEGTRNLLRNTRREVYVLGCVDHFRGDCSRISFGFC